MVIFASTCNEKQHLFKLYSYKKHRTLTDRIVCENSCLNAPLKKKIMKLTMLNLLTLKPQINCYLHTKKHDHITPVLKKLHWLPVSFRIEYKILLLCFKALHSVAPQYLCELIKKKISTRDLRPSSIHELIEPRSNARKYGDRAFAIIAPTPWNKLPSEIRSIDKLEPFKTKLKTHLYNQAFKHC